jgi:hypothetical protein
MILRYKMICHFGTGRVSTKELAMNLRNCMTLASALLFPFQSKNPKVQRRGRTYRPFFEALEDRLAEAAARSNVF